ncbi:MAG TPA: MBL fold metallo-hydrolase [Acidimicrobiales bacterium]
MDSQLYFRQLLAGRDIAVGNQVAAQMVNFVYLIGDRATGEAVAVDPAWDVEGLVEAAGEDGMRITGALVTHHHPDHVGGSMMGHTVEGLADLLARAPATVHVHEDEARWVQRVTGVSSSDLVPHASGDQIMLGDVAIEVLHTPGHTPGSECFLVDGRLVSGDTLFLDGCGRTDLPGGDPEVMYDSLSKLASLPPDVVVYPGHRYSVPSMGTMAAVLETNQAFQPRSKQEWLAIFGG